MTPAADSVRTVREAIEIRADAPAVWHALVRRDQTPRWLGTGARIEAKPGGACVWVDRRGGHFEGRVEQLSPTRRLVALFPDGGGLEFQLDHRPRGAMLRAVRTLRLALQDADELAAAEAREWRLALLALRAQVESGDERGRALASAWSPLARPQAWETLFGPGRLVLAGRVDQLQRRDGFHLTLTGGLELDGRAATVEPSAQFVGELPQGEVLALSALASPGRTLLSVALLGSPRPAAELAGAAASWQRALDASSA